MQPIQELSIHDARRIALLCQGLAPRKALVFAVCLHGAAADACVARGDGPVGLTASDVIAEAQRLLNAWILGSPQILGSPPSRG